MAGRETLNLKSMTGKASELVDMMDKTKVDLLCVQNTGWKGSKAIYELDSKWSAMVYIGRKMELGNNEERVWE